MPNHSLWEICSRGHCARSLPCSLLPTRMACQTIHCGRFALVAIVHAACRAPFYQLAWHAKPFIVGDLLSWPLCTQLAVLPFTNSHGMPNHSLWEICSRGHCARSLPCSLL